MLGCLSRKPPRTERECPERVRVDAYDGLRRGELVALHWRDVDFAGRKIIVRRALSAECSRNAMVSCAINS